MNVWIYLLMAIGLEVSGTLLLKMSNGFENWVLGSLAIGCYSICFWCLAPVLKVIPVGIAYAIWAGAGIALVTLAGLFLFEQKLSAVQLLCIGLIFVGAIGLNLTTHSATS